MISLSSESLNVKQDMVKRWIQMGVETMAEKTAQAKKWPPKSCFSNHMFMRGCCCIDFKYDFFHFYSFHFYFFRFHFYFFRFHFYFFRFHFVHFYSSCNLISECVIIKTTNLITK